MRTSFRPAKGKRGGGCADFAEGRDAAILRYDATRNRMDLAGTSQLSPYLRFGMISAGRRRGRSGRGAAARRTAGGSKGAETWLNELIWREFYQTILYSLPGRACGGVPA